MLQRGPLGGQARGGRPRRAAAARQLGAPARRPSHAREGAHRQTLTVVGAAQLGHRIGRRLGRARRDRGSTQRRRTGRAADALSLWPRRRQLSARRRPRRSESRSPRPGAARDGVLRRGEDAGERQHRAVRSLPARLRRARDRDGCADRRERGRRRGRRRVPPDRDPQEPRLHPGSGCGRLRSPGRRTRVRRLRARDGAREPARGAVAPQERAIVYGVGSLGVPVWIDAAVPASVCGLAALAALLPPPRWTAQRRPGDRERASAREAAAATPRTGCSGACRCPVRSRSGSRRRSPVRPARCSHSPRSCSARPRSHSPSGSRARSSASSPRSPAPAPSRCRSRSPARVTSGPAPRS